MSKQEGKKKKSAEPYEKVLEQAKEVAAVEQYWPMTSESKLRKPPKTTSTSTSSPTCSSS